MNPEPSELKVADPEETTTPRSAGRTESAATGVAAGAGPEAAPLEMAATRSVKLEGLNAYYGDTHAVRGVDLEFRPGHVTAIIGPSGCGKSTMVRCVNRMHEEIRSEEHTS